MSNVVYKSDLDVFVSQPVPGKSEPKMDVYFYYVETFESGSGGKIDLNSTSDSTIAAEMERIQKGKTVTLYLNSRISLNQTSQLIDLSKSNIKIFSVVFRVISYDRKEKKTLSVTAIIADAVLSETPIPVGGTPPSLKIKLSLSNVRQVKRVGDEISASVRSFRQISEDVLA